MRATSRHGTRRRGERLLAALLLALASCERGTSTPPVRVESVEFDFLERFEPAPEGGAAGPAAASRGLLLVEPPRGHARRARQARKAAVDPARGERAGLGLAQRSRPALIVPPGGSAFYRVAVPAGRSVLRYRPVVNGPRSVAPGDVDFAILVEDEIVAADALRRGERSVIAGAEREIPLDRWAGSSVGVTFRVTSGGEAPPGEDLASGFVRPRLSRVREVPRKPSSRDGRNVLLVVVDTLRADRLSCYGYDRETTPRLDALAARSHLYRFGYSSSAWTWPATASILTSLYPQEHGVIGEGRSDLHDDLTTLPEVFSRAGYATYGSSANPLVSTLHDFDQGFETFDEAFNESAADLVDRFLEWRSRNAASAFFAYLHFFDPHYPYRPPADALAEYRRGFLAEHSDAISAALPPQEGPHDAERLAPHRVGVGSLYDAEIRYWDSEFGRLLDRLADVGDLDRTIVVVTSDHGEELWDHGGLGHRTTLFQELIRVPLVVHVPGGGGPVEEEGAVETIDLFPTVCALAGVGHSRDIQGRVLPGILGARRESRPIYATTSLPGDAAARPELFSVIDGAKKLVVLERAGRESNPSARLYDLALDPAETRDRSDLEPSERDRLARLLDEWRAATPSRAPSLDRPWVQSITRQRLEALGYLGGGR